MDQKVAQFWAQAQGHEAARDVQAAKAAYEEVLKLDSSQTAAWLRLSAFATREDHYRTARLQALSAAKAVSEGSDWKHLPFVTMRLLTFDERNTIRDLILKADWSHRDVIAQSAVLSQHLWLINEFDAALRLIDEAQRHVPAHPLLSYSRANALRYCGRMEEATAEYERCIALAPDYAYAHWSLAYHQKADPLGSRIDRLKRAKASVAPGSLERIHLCYALFKELDDMGDVDQAWLELEEGAGQMRALIRFDGTEERRRLAALQALTTPEFFRGSDKPTGEREPIFIVGMPRTGTTLLERVLSNHPQVASGGELNDFAQSVSWEHDHFYGGPLHEHSIDRFAATDYPAIGREYSRRTEALAADRGYLIDKNPMNFFNAGFIRKALPQAKIVCLVRNPMDACFSNLKELFTNVAYGYSYDQAELAEHYARHCALRDHWQRTLSGQFRVVPYETLVSDPVGSTEEIMRFCGLAFEPQSVDITQNTAAVATASSSQVRQPIHTRGIGAWRRYEAQLEPLRRRLETLLPQ